MRLLPNHPSVAWLTGCQMRRSTRLERFCELVCAHSVMVVEADIEGFGHGVYGKFGKDEPWPEWVDLKDFVMEGLVDVTVTTLD